MRAVYCLEVSGYGYPLMQIHPALNVETRMTFNLEIFYLLLESACA
jgi:hypothetical protein